jgi:hypothetical protein
LLPLANVAAVGISQKSLPRAGDAAAAIRICQLTLITQFGFMPVHVVAAGDEIKQRAINGALLKR